MKKMLSIILVLISVIAASCESKTVVKGRKAYMDYFNKVLKDPESLVIYDEIIVEETVSTVKFVLDVGARNSLGGNVRKTYSVYVLGGKLMSIEEGSIID